MLYDDMIRGVAEPRKRAISEGRLPLFQDMNDHIACVNLTRHVSTHVSTQTKKHMEKTLIVCTGAYHRPREQAAAASPGLCRLICVSMRAFCRLGRSDGFILLATLSNCTNVF